MRLAWDRYTELGIPLPGWFVSGVQLMGAAAPEKYRKAAALASGEWEQIPAGASV